MKEPKYNKNNTLFSVEYSDTKVQELFGQLIQRAKDTRPALEDIGEFGLYVQDTHFKTQVDSEGKAWKPLSIVTIMRKRAMGRIMGPLQSTGLMRRRFNYRIINRNEVVIGNSDEKARKHQLGIDVAKREFIYFTQDDIREVVNILNDYVIGE